MKFVLTINCDDYTNVPRDLAAQLRQRADEIERRAEDIVEDHAFVVRNDRAEYVGFFILTSDDNDVNKLQDFDRTVLAAKRWGMFKRG